VGSKENRECGEHGICNLKTGLCECFPGFSSSDFNGGVGWGGDCGYFGARLVGVQDAGDSLEVFA
jgi:hypothetical protein